MSVETGPASAGNEAAGRAPGRRGPGSSLLLLGPPELRMGGRFVTLPARKDMAMLARAPGRILSRERLAGTLWGERTQARARDSLRHALSRLQPAFGAQDATRGSSSSSAGPSPWTRRSRPKRTSCSGPGARRRSSGPWSRPPSRSWRSRSCGGPTRPATPRAPRRPRAGSSAPIPSTRRRSAPSRGATPRAASASTPLRCSGSPATASPPSPSPSLPPPRAEGAGSAVAALVLPFANLGDDLLQDFSAAGLAEDIAIDLARLSGLAVIPFQPGAGHRALRNPAWAARAGGADLVLSGSVRREQGRFRITARLLAAPTRPEPSQPALRLVARGRRGGGPRHGRFGSASPGWSWPCRRARCSPSRARSSGASPATRWPTPPSWA